MINRREALQASACGAVALTLPLSPVRAMPRNDAVDLDHLVVRHRRVSVGGVEIFYREAGRRNARAVLLLHGFPASSHMSVI